MFKDISSSFSISNSTPRTGIGSSNLDDIPQSLYYFFQPLDYIYLYISNSMKEPISNLTFHIQTKMQQTEKEHTRLIIEVRTRVAFSESNEEPRGKAEISFVTPL